MNRKHPCSVWTALTFNQGDRFTNDIVYEGSQNVHCSSWCLHRSWGTPRVFANRKYLPLMLWSPWSEYCECAFMQQQQGVLNYFYRPLSEASEGYIFTGISLFSHGGGGLCLHGGGGGGCLLTGVCLLTGSLYTERGLPSEGVCLLRRVCFLRWGSAYWLGCLPTGGSAYWGGGLINTGGGGSESSQSMCGGTHSTGMHSCHLSN